MPPTHSFYSDMGGWGGPLNAPPFLGIRYGGSPKCPPPIPWEQIWRGEGPLNGPPHSLGPHMGGVPKLTPPHSLGTDMGG